MSDVNNRISTYTIYLITNQINGKNYVGKHKLRKTERLDSRSYMGSGQALKDAKLKYGVDNFSKEILAVCYSEYEYNLLEKIFISLYKEIGKAEYNETSGGENGDFWNYISEERKQELKLKHHNNIKQLWENKEYRDKQSKSHKGKPSPTKGAKFSESHKRNLSISHLGNKQSEESKQKISEKLRGREIPTEQRKQISDALKGTRYYTNGVIEVRRRECPEGFTLGRLPKDRHHKESTIELIRKRRAEQVFTQESINKRTESLKKYNDTPEGKATRKRVGEMNKGNSYSKGKKHPGFHIYNNGVVEARAKECPDGFVPGRLEINKLRISQSMKEYRKLQKFNINGKE